MCVCVRERQREKAREIEREGGRERGGGNFQKRIYDSCGSAGIKTRRSLFLQDIPVYNRNSLLFLQDSSIGPPR